MLATGQDERALKLLQRLQDTFPDQTFYGLALAHEQERQAVLRLNRFLEKGEIAEGRQFLRKTLAGNAASTTLAVAQPLMTALLDLNDYVAQTPFADSATAEAALARVTSHQDVLAESATFGKWLAVQKRIIAELRRKEQEVILRGLLAKYDLAVVSARPDVTSILARIQAMAPEHPLPKAVKLATAGKWQELCRMFVSVTGQQMPVPSALEAVLCPYWGKLPVEEKHLIGAKMAKLKPMSTCGSLLVALLAADAGDVPRALAHIKKVAATGPIASGYLSYLLDTVVLPKEQYRAGCWRSPFPAVTDLLSRITQVHEHQTKEKR